MKKLTEIEGIGASYSSKLQNAGIDSIEELLEKGAALKKDESNWPKTQV